MLCLRVDIHRKDNAGGTEKAITIHSSKEGCSQACRMILEIMEKEANDTKMSVSLQTVGHIKVLHASFALGLILLRQKNGQLRQL